VFTAIRKPLGVCVEIALWNAPVILGVRAIAMPLACGNTVVLKASEARPAVHRLTGTALHEGRAPNGVVNVITHDPADTPEIAGATIDHPAARHINFTAGQEAEAKLLPVADQLLTDIIVLMGDAGSPSRVIFNPNSKTKKGHRFIPVNHRVMNILLVRCADPNEGWGVSIAAKGQAHHHRLVNKQWVRARKKAALPDDLLERTLRLARGRGSLGQKTLPDTMPSVLLMVTKVTEEAAG
jgi:hypothetical protein